MLTVGLCGGSGTGKNLVSSLLAPYGIPSLDTDALYHTLIAADSPLSRELISLFGDEIGTADGGIDRAALGRLVFGEEKEAIARRLALNRVTHSAILAECRLWLKKQAEKGVIAAVINAPLLFESGFQEECDLTVAVLASEEVRLARVCERDDISAEAARARIAAQKDNEYLMAHADISLFNDGTQEELEEKVRELVKTINMIAEEQTNGKRKPV